MCSALVSEGKETAARKLPSDENERKTKNLKESAINPLSISASALSGEEPAKNADRFQPQDQKETEALNDLEVSEQNETAIKGGPDGYDNGGLMINHSAAVSENSEEEAEAANIEPVEDLPLPLSAAQGLGGFRMLNIKSPELAC